MSARYDVVELTCDAYGGKLALIPALKQAGLNVRILASAETVAARSKLEDLVTE